MSKRRTRKRLFIAMNPYRLMRKYADFAERLRRKHPDGVITDFGVKADYYVVACYTVYYVVACYTIGA